MPISTGDRIGVPPDRVATPASIALLAAIDSAETNDDLDHNHRCIWELHGTGQLTDDVAQTLADQIEYRRSMSRRPEDRQSETFKRGPAWTQVLAARPLPTVLGSRFVPRKHRALCSEQRHAARQRRRTLGGSGVMPDNMRRFYTEGERAVLCIVAGEVRQQGLCDLPIDKIAALAGVGRTTVQNAIHEARRLGHVRVTPRPVRGAKNKTNVIEIVSPEWRNWIKRGRTASTLIGSKPPKKMNPTKTSGHLVKSVFDDGNERRGDGPPLRPALGR